MGWKGRERECKDDRIGTEKGQKDHLQERQRQIAVNARLEFDLDVEVQLDAQLQAILLHDIGTAGFGVDALGGVQGWLGGAPRMGISPRMARA